MLSDPTKADTDGDGLDDLVEFDSDGIVSPVEADSDGDGLSDGDELLNYQTKPDQRDSDEDSFGDGFEVAQGSDPLEAGSVLSVRRFSMPMRRA